MKSFVGAFATAALLAAAGQSYADEIEVRGEVRNFSPEVVFAKPGDTVKWVNMTSHDSASIEGLIPEGATAWQGPLGKGFDIKVEKEGVYIYKCTPHFSMGMIGAIVVGKPSNLDKLKASAEGPAIRMIKKVEAALAEQPAQ